MRNRRPLGVYAILAGNSSPLAAPCWKLIPALLYGNTVVWKPSEKTLLTALACQALVTEAARRVGAPAAVSSVVLGGASVGEALTEVFRRLSAEAPSLFAPGAKRKSDFFRDIAGSQYLSTGEVVAKESGIRYDFLLNVFDRSIIEVENRFGRPLRRKRSRFLRRGHSTKPHT